MKKISAKPPKTWRETHARANDLYTVRNSDIVIIIWFISSGQLNKTFTSVIYKWNHWFKVLNNSYIMSCSFINLTPGVVFTAICLDPPYGF